MSTNLILFILFCAAWAVQMYYLFFVFGKLFSFKSTTNTHTNEPVSIIICAKNEDDNLRKNLPLIFAQEYPNFEVVVVNDCSLDATEEVLKEFLKNHNNLHVVHLKEEHIHDHNKKLALMMGIKGAKHDLLLLTDADCEPRNNQWISNMSRNAVAKKELVLGYGAYKKEKGLLNKLIRWDVFSIAIQYLSFALKKDAYMGVGRNLAYRKSLFFANRGFANHYHIKSGDDDLFVNQVSNDDNTCIEISPDSHTVSEPKRTFREWFDQKKRHVTTSIHYRLRHKFQLFLLSTSLSFLWILLVILLVSGFNYILLSSFILLRIISQLIIYHKITKSLGEKDLLFGIPFFEICFVFLYPSIALANLFTKNHKWK